MQRVHRVGALVVAATSHGPRLAGRASHAGFEASDDALAALREDVLFRRRNRATAWIAEHRDLLDTLAADHWNTPALIGLLAQWMEACDGLPEIVQKQLAKYPAPVRRCRPVLDYLSLCLADGIRFLRPGDFDLAVALAEDASAQDLLALAHFWKAQALHKAGDLEGALSHAAQARTLALHTDAGPLAAVAEGLEGTLHLEKGRLTRALELLREAEANLRGSEDWLWYGRIQAALGEAAVEEGRYEEALDCLGKAAGLFENNAAPRADRARVYTVLARAQRLAAARIAARIDAAAKSHRRSPAGAGNRGADLTARSRVEELRSGALVLLAQAGSLYSSLGDVRENTLCGVECGFLNLDCGDLERAAQQAVAAFEAGSRENDALTMAQASMLHSRAESAWFEEGIGRDLARHSLRARERATSAIALASKLSAANSRERRTLASAYLTEGFVFANEFFNDIEAARECCHRAGEYLNFSTRDYLWEEYRTLTAKVLRQGAVDEKLRRWTQGVVESSTFQQMTEEFAELVIPSVWAREGRNISRVVSRLSISPKKVRRILSRAGVKA